MVAWLVGIGIAGFGVSLFLAVAQRPEGLRERLGRPAFVKWCAGSLLIAVVGIGLAVALAWPAWFLGRFLGPYFDVSGRTGAVIFACIFGVGGAALTGAANVAFNEQFEEDTASPL